MPISERESYHKDANADEASERASFRVGDSYWKLRTKTANRSFFVRLHIENREKPGDLQQVVDAFRQMKKFQFAFRVANGGVAADEFADPRAVDVVHIVEVENDFAVALLDQVADGAAESGTALTQSDLSAEIYDCDIFYLTACAL